jgi:hypothetical protein
VPPPDHAPQLAQPALRHPVDTADRSTPPSSAS